ncbi:hypothetical protein TD95_005013 [Thielaviopsis punctulata]|uniref:Endoplasmic reticulum transmembrane protein n=1 Tax=Thielaviopsis punctulata TaxID=72032 RepID=A0A0F4ZCB2_9PEZI|nr:hypothetical protein TD95_005013 [Thielaviopsis punctulata]
MTLYYSLVFFLLMFEVAVFFMLVVPMPYTFKKKLFKYNLPYPIRRSPLVAKAQYWLKITFVFVLILFADSVMRVYRVQIELFAATEAAAKNAGAGILGHERTEVQARKFYAQRNMYLCGFTLLLSLILNRTYSMILELIRLEEKVRTLESTRGASSDVAALKQQLAAKDRDLQTLKKQSKQLHDEYGSLSDKYSATQEDGVSKKEK